MKVTILLSTYNGEKYLQEQLDSLFSQTYNDFVLIVRDDSSSDNSLEILKNYKQKYSQKIILLEENDNKGVIRSFSYLLEYALKNTNANYFMFCDQDDVWKPKKIEKTLLKMLELEKNKNKPVLIHTDLELVDENLNLIHPSFWKHEHIFPEHKSFNRLIMQNNITGCTVMINRVLAQKSLPIPENSIMHDWWIALVAAYFGEIDYINESTIKYRQHGSNTLGAKGYKQELLKNIGRIINSVLFKRGEFYKHHYINILQAKEFLERYKDELDISTIKILEDFIHLEKKSFFERRKILLKNRILKQGILRNIGLMLNV